MSWFTSATSREQLLAITPDYQRHFNALYEALWTLREIPAPVLELCRLRLAQLHESEVEWQREEVPVPQPQRDQLHQWDSSELFTEAERACIGFAEVYAMDPQAITDAQANAVKSHFGDPGLVALVEALGLFYGLTRLSLLWELQAIGRTTNSNNN